VLRPNGWLDRPARCSTFVLMEVETLGERGAWDGAFKCAAPTAIGWKRAMRKCVYRKQLDLGTLVASPNFPRGGWRRV
jgi:hypothetical protein